MEATVPMPREDYACRAALADARVEQREQRSEDEFEQDGIAGDDPDGMKDVEEGTDGDGEGEQDDEAGDGPLDGLEKEEAEDEIEEHLEHHGPGVAHDEAVAGVVEGGHEKECGEVVALKEIAGESEAREHEESDEPVDGVDANETALHEVSHGCDAVLAALAEDDEREDEAADDEEDVDTEDVETEEAGGAVLDECLAGVTPDDEDDGDGTQNLEAVNLTDGWGEG